MSPPLPKRFRDIRQDIEKVIEQAFKGQTLPGGLKVTNVYRTDVGAGGIGIEVDLNGNGLTTVFHLKLKWRK